MKRNGSKRGRALLVNSELDVRRTITRFLQLHGMDVVHVDSLHEATGRLSTQGEFDLLVTEIVTPEHADWHEWKRMVTHAMDVSLLVHGNHAAEWDDISHRIGRSAGFVGKPFTLSDFHWALNQLL